MKRLLLILLVLGLVVPVSAEVFVYNVKTKGVELDYYADSGWTEWTEQKVTQEDGPSYVICEPNEINHTIKVWFIDTWTWKEDGKNVKYAQIDPWTSGKKLIFIQGIPGTYNKLDEFVPGNKTIWVISGFNKLWDLDTNDVNNVDVGWIKGEAKPRKIGNQKATVAATLTGFEMCQMWSVRDKDPDYYSGLVYRTNISWRLNSNLSLLVQGHIGEEAVDIVLDYLEKHGYEIWVY